MDSSYIFKILSDGGVTTHLVPEHYRFYFKLSSIVRFIAENSEIVLQAYLEQQENLGVLLFNHSNYFNFHINLSIHPYFVFQKLAPILVGMNKNITNKSC